MTWSNRMMSPKKNGMVIENEGKEQMHPTLQSYALLGFKIRVDMREPGDVARLVVFQSWLAIVASV